MGGNWRSRSCQENARQNEIRSNSALECAVEKICKGWCDNDGGFSRFRNARFIDTGRGDAIAVCHHVSDTSSFCGCNLDAWTEDDAKAGNSVRTITDTGRNLDANIISISFTDCVATARTIAGSERNTATEYETKVSGARFADSNAHYSFNCDARAFGSG